MEDFDENFEIEGVGISSEENDDDDPTYDPKSIYQKPLIIQRAVEDCRVKRSTEMNKGFWNNKLDKMGNPLKTWVADERKIYIGSVIALRQLLCAECNKDNKFKIVETQIKKKLNSLFERFSYDPYTYDTATKSWKKTGFKFMPQLKEDVMIPQNQNQRIITPIVGGWDGKVNTYYDQLVPLYDELFGEINLLISRLDDFAQATGY